MNGDVWITWKWIGGIALSALLSIGGYSLVRLDERVTQNETRAFNAAARSDIGDVQYREIIRRLDRIENRLDALTPTVRTNPFPAR